MKPAIIRPELELKHEIKEVPARNVIYLRLFGDYKLNDYCSACMRLCQFIQEEKLPMGEVMPYCIYHDAGRYAIFLYKGPYEHLQAVYDTIYGKYIPEMECSLRDESSAERYLNNPADTAPEELLTEIYIPVE